MENIKTNLIKLFLLKERVHWKRIKLGFRQFDGLAGKILGGGIITVFITIFHYIFAFPHFIFECAMWCFVRGQFKMNMVNLHNDALNKLETFKKQEKKYANK